MQKTAILSKKTLLICDSFYPCIGGAEKALLEYTRDFIVDGHEVTVLTGSDKPSSYSIDGKIKVLTFPWRKIGGHSIPWIGDIARHAEKSDHIYTVLYTSAIPAWFVARKYSKPITLIVFEVLFKKWYWVEDIFHATLHILFELLVLKFHFTRYIAISQSTKRDLEIIIGKERSISVIYPYKQKEMAKKAYENTPACKRFLYFGRLGKTKGIDILLAAIHKDASYLRTNQCQFTLRLFAENKSEHSKLLAEIDAHKITDLVSLKGPIEGNDYLDRMFEEVDCVIVPSITEGFGFSAIEACENGMPLICSDAGSLPEVIFGKINMFINQDTQSLVNAIRKSTKGDFAMIKRNQFGPE